MFYRLEDTKKAEKLFKDWQETVIWSCLQKVMGDIYVDDLQSPASVMAILGDLCFFAGKVNKELVLFKPKDCKNNFIIMVPQNDSWSDVIESEYGSRAKKVERYAIKKEKEVFNVEKLEKIVNSLDKKYTLMMIDKDIYNICLAEEWSKDLVSVYKSYNNYSKLGFGVTIFKDNELVAGASSYTSYKEGIEIEIDTKLEYRRNGLAYVCGAKLILECLKRNLYPSWDAQNKWSIALSEKLGYHFDKSYVAYEVYDY